MTTCSAAWSSHAPWPAQKRSCSSDTPHAAPIKGAIDDVEMGNLTGLLARVKPAISGTKFTGERSSKNAAYVDAVARTNVLLGLDGIRRRSPILADLEKKGTIQIVGGMYDLATGSVEFLSERKSERG
jgi:carbonic anhydrase